MMFLKWHDSVEKTGTSERRCEEETFRGKHLFVRLTMEKGEQEDQTYSKQTLLKNPEVSPGLENLEKQAGDSRVMELSENENGSVPTGIKTN